MHIIVICEGLSRLNACTAVLVDRDVFLGESAENSLCGIIVHSVRSDDRVARQTSNSILLGRGRDAYSCGMDLIDPWIGIDRPYVVSQTVAAAQINICFNCSLE